MELPNKMFVWLVTEQMILWLSNKQMLVLDSVKVMELSVQTL